MPGLTALHSRTGSGFWQVSIRATVGYQAAQVRTEGSGVTTGGFGFTGLDLLSFGTLHRDIAFGVVYTPGLGSAGFGTGSKSDSRNSDGSARTRAGARAPVGRIPAIV